ncbi:MAG: hypothetical protein ACRC4W_08155 [Treponemataceae bacterium]
MTSFFLIVIAVIILASIFICLKIKIDSNKKIKLMQGFYFEAQNKMFELIQANRNIDKETKEEIEKLHTNSNRNNFNNSFSVLQKRSDQSIKG